MNTEQPQPTNEAVGSASDIECAVRQTLIEMFEADTEYGCGFYGYEPWRIAYAKLQKMVGYRGNTTDVDLHDKGEINETV